MSGFEHWELPKRVPVEVAERYFYWLGTELAKSVMLYYGDEQTVGAELVDIRDTLKALQGERGEVIIKENEMAPCGVVYERK